MKYIVKDFSVDIFKMACKFFLCNLTREYTILFDGRTTFIWSANSDLKVYIIFYEKKTLIIKQKCHGYVIIDIIINTIFILHIRWVITYVTSFIM
jgi:hypothetical protein